LYGDRDQLGLVVDVKFAHQVEFVRFHRLDADSQNGRCFSYGKSLGEQLHDFTLAQRQGTSPQRHPRRLVPEGRVVLQFRLDLRTQ
jgi:hypothetical protein